MNKKLVIIIVLAVILYILRSTRSSGYSCASTNDLMSVQAQGAQCYRCSDSWEGGDCIKRLPGGRATPGNVSVYDASSSIDNAFPGYLFRWPEGTDRPDPAYPALWTPTPN